MRILLMVPMLILTVLVTAGDVLAAGKISADTMIEEGITKTVFQMDEGFVTVYLPAEIVPGDTISGSLTYKPFGLDSDTRQANKKRLESYSIEIRRAEKIADSAASEADGKRKKADPPTAAAANPTFSGTIPEKTRTIEVYLLKDGSKAKYDRLKIASEATSLVQSDNCQLPSIAQCNHPTIIRTAADGLADNTIVEVGGTRCDILAESPRMIIFKSPAEHVGATTLSFSEGDSGAQCDLVNLEVKLSAAQLKLRKGERSKMTVRINGLKDTNESVELVLKNLTPEVVEIIGGDDQVVKIPVGGVR